MKTLGQIAFEAGINWIRKEVGLVDPVFTWDDIGQIRRDAWEISASAAIKAYSAQKEGGAA